MNRLGNIGILLVGVASCVFAYAFSAKPPKLDLTRPEYQIVQLGDMARNQFLMDKNSGRIWQKECNGEIKDLSCDGEIMWSEMFIENLSPPDSPVSGMHIIVNQQIDAAAKRTAPKFFIEPPKPSK